MMNAQRSTPHKGVLTGAFYKTQIAESILSTRRDMDDAKPLFHSGLSRARLRHLGSLLQVVGCRRRKQRVGHLKALECQVRLDAVELLAQFAEHLGEAAGRDDERRFPMRPLGLDAANDPVDRVGG